MDVQIPWLLFVVAGAIYLMMAGGVQKRALEWKRVPRTCPACGRDRSKGRCSCQSP